MGAHRSRRCAEGGVLNDRDTPRLFGRRQDRPLKARQARLLETLLPEIAVTPDTVADVVARHDGPVWLEVGFGGGEHLAWQAERNPGVLMIGAEPFINGTAKLLAMIEERGLSNVRIRHGDARDLMAAIPSGRVARAFVLHPDPWPKRKHWKRRIVSEAFLSEMHRLTAPSAELRVASDIPDYVRWTLVMRNRAEAAGAPWAWTAERMTDWTLRPGDWPQTRYEAKAIREGRTPTYLSFRRTAAE